MVAPRTAADSPSSRLLGLFTGQRLTPVQRRIAQSLVEHAPRAAYLSSSDVAELAGVSQPSVTRFATAVGYDGYQALRQRIRELVSEAQTGRPGIETRDEARRNEWQRAVTTERDNLAELSQLLADPAPVLQAARLLSASRPLPVLGLRAARPIAEYFGYFAAKIHPDVRVLHTGGSLLTDRIEQARAAGATALLTFALPRYPVEALDAIRESREAGLRTVTLSDNAMSPAADLSDVVLPAAVGTQLVFDMHSAPMVLATVLLQAMCDAAPTETQRRLESFERSASRRGLFVP